MSVSYSAYESQHFNDCQILYAHQLTAIESAIIGMQTQDTTFSNSIDSLQGDVKIPDYSASSTYIIGDRVMHDDLVYECKSNIVTPEAWNSTHWTAQASAGTLEARMKRKIALLDSGDTTTTNNYVTQKISLVRLLQKMELTGLFLPHRLETKTNT